MWWEGAGLPAPSSLPQVGRKENPMEHTDNQARLLRYAERFTADGHWSPLGDDARPDALILQEQGLVEVNADETQYRVAGDYQIPYRKPP